MPRPRQRLTPEEREAERRAPLRWWPVPIEVRLTPDAQRLEWHYDPNEEERRERRDAKGNMLERFLSFADERVQAKRIESFARSFGVFHDEGRQGAEVGYDHVESWRETARDFGAILACAAECKERRIVSRTDRWERVAHLAGWGLDEHLWGELQPMLYPALVADAANRVIVPSVWLGLQGGVTRGFRLLMGGVNLRGALCAEVLRELQGRERSMVPCAACGSLHWPRGQSGRRSFCTVCAKSGAPGRFAKRDYNARRKLKRAAEDASRAVLP